MEAKDLEDGWMDGGMGKLLKPLSLSFFICKMGVKYLPPENGCKMLSRVPII